MASFLSSNWSGSRFEKCTRSNYNTSMANQNQIRKSQSLGMNFSTADYRLKKMILFSLLERHHENICYRCDLPIRSVDDLSVEHKEPWLDVDASLFWDLDNIAFSHHKCNYAKTRTDTIARKTEYEARRNQGNGGTAWCRRHQRYLPVADFAKNASRWNGLQSECQECRAKNPSRQSKKLERTTGNDPATSALATLRSTN